MCCVDTGNQFCWKRDLLSQASQNVFVAHLFHAVVLCCRLTGGAGGKGVWGAAGMVYEDEEPDVQDPNYDESAQVSESLEFRVVVLQLASLSERVGIEDIKF